MILSCRSILRTFATAGPLPVPGLRHLCIQSGSRMNDSGPLHYLPFPVRLGYWEQMQCDQGHSIDERSTQATPRRRRHGCRHAGQKPPNMSLITVMLLVREGHT